MTSASSPSWGDARADRRSDAQTVTTTDIAGTRASGVAAGVQELANAVSRRWWVPLVSGLLLFAVGLAILTAHWTVRALVVTAGLLFVLRGLALVFSPQHARASSGEHLVAGLVSIVAGILLIAWPGPTLLVLAFFVGTWLAVSGAFHVIVSIARRQQLPHWVISLVVGGVEFLLGVWVMRRPDVTLELVIVTLGLWATITGIAFCILAFELRTDVLGSRSGGLPPGPALPAT